MYIIRMSPSLVKLTYEVFLSKIHSSRALLILSLVNLWGGSFRLIMVMANTFTEPFSVHRHMVEDYDQVDKIVSIWYGQTDGWDLNPGPHVYQMLYRWAMDSGEADHLESYTYPICCCSNHFLMFLSYFNTRKPYKYARDHLFKIHYWIENSIGNIVIQLYIKKSRNFAIPFYKYIWQIII